MDVIFSLENPKRGFAAQQSEIYQDTPPSFTQDTSSLFHADKNDIIINSPFVESVLRAILFVSNLSSFKYLKALHENTLHVLEFGEDRLTHRHSCYETWKM